MCTPALYLIVFVPLYLLCSCSAVTSTSPASQYWGITQSITYGSSHTTILSSTAGIVDTGASAVPNKLSLISSTCPQGTTLLLIASDALAKYQKATGATSDASTGLLAISSSGFSKLQSLYFKIGGVSLLPLRNHLC